MKRLIVNADDFGYDTETVDWTIKGFESGKLSSATIMAGFSETKRAVEYAKDHPEFSFGIHFYLTDEKPVSNLKDIPSMIDPSTGKLWFTEQFIKRALIGKVAKSDVAKEMKAQYDSLVKMGLRVTHADGHGHMHKLPPCLSALIMLKGELGIRTVRRTQNWYWEKPSFKGRLINCLMGRWLNRHFKTVDTFLMTAGKTQDRKWFSKAVMQLPEGVTEIGIHPGANPEWRVIDTEDAFNTILPADVQMVTYNEI